MEKIISVKHPVTKELITIQMKEIANLKLLDRYRLMLSGLIIANNVYEDFQWMINVDLSIKVMNKQNVYSILTNKLNRLNDIKQV
ncbi:unnamed protein product [Rotaria sordida]|uniref:Uncharacterized protein n=1 Tax=Rotaria sordida TaxID=392033 RepID=A0A818SQV2_9BILA|nr:unnamed protein product [Rotaria sordida]